MHIEFFPFAGLTHTARLRDDLLYIRVSDLLDGAPQPVVYAVALILLAKIYRRTVDYSHHETYRSFILTNPIQEKAKKARTARGRGPKPAIPKGRWQNLDVNFDRLNARYFGGKLDVHGSHGPRNGPDTFSAGTTRPTTPSSSVPCSIRPDPGLCPGLHPLP